MTTSKKNLYLLFFLLLLATFTSLFLVKASWQSQEEELVLDSEELQEKLAELRRSDPAVSSNAETGDSVAEIDPPRQEETEGVEDVLVVGSSPETEEELATGSFLLKAVPFTSQAPYGKWDLVHEEACEEASLIIVHSFATGRTQLTKAYSEEQIQALKEYQLKTTGQFIDSDMEELMEIAKGFYELELEVVYDFELEDIKKQLRRGSPVIIPTAGRRLGNPNFTPPGPLYHNLVVIGYDEDKSEFITHDPGTRNGENYRYDQQLLYNAIHDYPGDKTKIETGRKAMVVLKETPS